MVFTVPGCGYPASPHVCILQNPWYKEQNNKAAPLLAELQASDFQHRPLVLFPWSCGFLSTGDSPSGSVVRSNVKTLPDDLKDFTQFRWSYIYPWKQTETGKRKDTRVCLCVETWGQPSHTASSMALLRQRLPLPHCPKSCQLGKAGVPESLRDPPDSTVPLSQTHTTTPGFYSSGQTNPGPHAYPASLPTETRPSLMAFIINKNISES